MKPFDLEAAKRGEPICTIEGELRHFIGKRLSGNLIVEVPSNEQSYTTSAEFLRMASKKRTVWVNFWGGVSALYYASKEDADAANPYSYNRIGGKAYPVEIEE